MRSLLVFMRQLWQRSSIRKRRRCLLCAFCLAALGVFVMQQIWVMLLTSNESPIAETMSWLFGSVTHLSKEKMLSKWFQLSYDFVNELPEDTVDQLLDRAVSLNRTKLLLVDPQYGLGNRLRVIASCLAFAEETSRMLVLIWRKDEHMGAAFEDLITSYPQFMLSIPNFSMGKPFHEVLIDFKVYDLMATNKHGGRKKTRLQDGYAQHIYLKTAFMLKSPHAQKPSMWLKKLVPLYSIQKMYSLKNDMEHVVAVHIRGLTLEEERFVDPPQAYPPRSRKFLEKWRGITGNSTIFAEEMVDLLRRDDQLLFFVLSDKEGIVRNLRRIFFDKVLALENCCSSRGVDCVQCAFAGILLASRMKGFLGSYGSSYSESIILLGKKRHKFVKLAGIDF